MPRFHIAIALLAGSLFTGACAATMTVSSHVEQGLDFSRYRSFDWGPADALPTGDPRLDKDPFFKDHVQGAVEKQLAARGLTLATGGAPDVLIHYHANIRERIEVNRIDQAYGYCGGANCPPETSTHEAGTLVLDFIDARSKKLIWRGWAQNSVEDLLHDQDKMAEAIDEAVTKMLQRLPPSGTGQQR
jgi:hypothetical protein